MKMPTADQFEKQHVKVAEGARVLIAGSRVYNGRPDRRNLFRDAVGVDAIDGPGVDVCLDLEGDITQLGEFDHIECRSVLEHSRRPWLLARNLITMLKVGGSLHIAAPFMWRYHGYPDDYWRFTAQGIQALFEPHINWVSVAYASNELSTKPNRRYLMDADGYPHLARSEVVAFGFKIAH
jgi:hypothetical protein